MQSTVNQISIPGFSPEQISALSKLISDAVDQALDRHFGPLQQPDLTSPIKKKRNQKTRQQYKKKKAQAQAQRVTIQEVDHIQEVEHLEAGKHVFLQSWKVATSPQHAVISCFEMASFIDGLIMVQNGAICRSRMGVG